MQQQFGWKKRLENWVSEQKLSISYPSTFCIVYLPMKCMVHDAYIMYVRHHQDNVFVTERAREKKWNESHDDLVKSLVVPAVQA